MAIGQAVTVARIYLREGEHLLSPLLEHLQAETVRGVSVVRGIAGIGSDGVLHTASLLTLSLDLPLIVEFYDSPGRVEEILLHLESKLGLTHVVTWPANVRLRGD
ncbi:MULTISPECIES: DUF190 domain-containing protein [Methylomonas]|uniref:DUF190 domain-containing protein n=1 Tax=Methylomonas TaxID=416 RepID=UPI0012327752|nr:DUF190 domain-containing protein [Methylomonas rhizoryzae]